MSGAASASFVYDGDGNRVKATLGVSTTAYVGDYFEWKDSTSMVKYYYANGQRVAMREDATLYYLLTDHLGSTAITANSSGERVAELRYKAWGENRYTYGTTPTTYRFTSQRLDESTGLMYYGARYYDAALGRFVQADTIVPEPGNPQALNRYSYVLNNPLRYIDRDGRTPWDVVDVIFWAISVYEFAHEPSLANAAWALLDTASLLPIIPSVGFVRRGAQAASLYDEIVEFATRYGDELLDFAKIAHKKGAINLLRKFTRAGKNWRMVKGAKAELEYALKFSDEIVEIGRKLEGGAEIDFVLKGNVFVNVKDYNWASDFYHDSKHIQWVINDFREQIRRYQEYTDKIKYVFKGSVPDAVRAFLEAAGVVVEVIP